VKSDKNLYPRMQRDLACAVVRAYRRFGTVRKAAEYLGMPRASFHDLLNGSPAYRRQRTRELERKVQSLKATWGMR